MEDDVSGGRVSNGVWVHPKLAERTLKGPIEDALLGRTHYLVLPSGLLK
jgi:hypothetical protein